MSETKNGEIVGWPPMLDDSGTQPVAAEEYVRWAYRLLLGREPESLAVVENNPFKNDRRRLLQSMLSSSDFHANYKTTFEKPGTHPYDSWNKEASAVIYLPQTGESPLCALLGACFPQNRIFRGRRDSLHRHSPAELTGYDFFQGHFDYFSLRFIPRRHFRSVAILCDPVRRLISWYRFSRSHPRDDEFANDNTVRLAKELCAEEYFEHELVTSSGLINNSYLLFFGSSIDDDVTLAALGNPGVALAAPASVDHSTAADFFWDDTVTAGIFARATQRILSLDAIGLTERFQESVETIFVTLGFPSPQTAVSSPLAGALTSSNGRAPPVPMPPVPMTARLAHALDRLTRYDRILYDIARREFDRRRSAVPSDLALSTGATDARGSG